jgi:2-iminobutanoate/2-iminopropanoate deaminase
VGKQVHRIEGTVAPMGPYSVATESNGFVFIAGQVALDPVTNERVDGDVTAQARRVMQNLELILDGVGLGFDDVVKTNVYLTDMEHYAPVNEVYGEYFTEGQYPARAAFAVDGLPGGFLVEIEAVAAR